jgi:ATP-dependent RNA helicase SUPV3L1/SUV3
VTKPNLTAVLGPTNTGKTHLAVERMLAYPTGMIGLPLRLLAREVFDKVRLRIGDRHVALITGEEKIIPPQARYWVCTVEAMPSDIDAAFVAIDEVQLASDFERGHVFTDRLMHWRGRQETMFLGADTMRGLLENLIPGLQFVHRPRFSKLTYAGQKKVSRLPRRSAVVGFSAETVYALAELIRRQRGGAAVVLGALSPRTRNAQVELYQSGDVDYIVATDAIGMGLNMDVDHVAFSSSRKFDGFQFRNLTPSEMGQIAGRAGRYMNDGTFGVTGQAQPLDAETVEQLENHRFEPVRVLQWRNRRLNFSSIDALQASLAELPRKQGLTRAQPAADVDALEFLARDAAVRDAATSRDTVSLLWDVCQIPDYRNISGAEHAHLVERVFNFLITGPGTIPPDWFAKQLSYCDRADGDIDTLSNRIAHVRTWTFVANRTDWLDDAIHWQERSREIEDKLSDALHERLSQRFVDRKTAVLMKRLRQKEEIMSVVEDSGDVLVENELVGRMTGLTFAASGEALGKPMKEAVRKTVADELLARAQAIAAAPDPDFTLSPDGAVVWQSAALAQLTAGACGLKPAVKLLADDLIETVDRDAVQQRIEKYVQRHVTAVLEPLVGLTEADELTGIARGLAFRLVENYGVLPRTGVAEEVKSLGQDERGQLRKFGVRFGAIHLFVPALLKPAATQLRVLLWALEQEKPGNLARADLPEIPGQGLTSVPLDRTAPDGFYQVIGYKPCGGRAVRIDMLERLSDLIRERVFWRPRFEGDQRPAGSLEGGGFVVIPDMMSLVGCSGEEFDDILRALDFKSQSRPAEDVRALLPVPPQPKDQPQQQPPQTAVAEDSGELTARSEPAALQHDQASAVAEPEASPTDDAALAASPQVADQPDTPAADAPAAPEMIDVWWPNRTGPFKARKDRPAHRQARSGNRPAQQHKPNHKGRAKPPTQAKHSKPKRREREIRPEDSPFAALSALRAQMNDKG